MDENLYLEELGYTITIDISIIDELYNINPEVDEILQETYYWANKGKKSAIKLIQQYIKKYPRIPHFKNHLSVLYNNIGNMYKFNEVNKKIVEEHPEYLFGKLNMASSYYYDKEYEKMTEVLGKKMDLKSLYPMRDTFHANEVLNFLKTSILYYSAIENTDKAEESYETMLEIENHFELGHDESKQVSYTIAALRMQRMQGRFEEEEKTKITVKITPEPVQQKTEPPVFTHPEIEILYEKDFSIEKENLQKILFLPRETLIEDLIKVLNDSIERQEYFEKEMDEIGYKDELHSFPIHAFFLLGELEATSHLKAVLNYLKRDSDFYDFWFSDLFTEYFWEPMYKLSHNNLSTLKEFMLEPGVDTHTKTLVNTVVEEIALREPSRWQEVINWYKEIFDVFLNSKIEDNLIDSDLLALMTWSIAEFNGTELLPEIEELYKKEYPTLSICGDFNEVKEIFNKEAKNTEKILSIFERYEDFVNRWYNKNDNEYNDRNNSTYDYTNKTRPDLPNFKNQNPIPEKKAGRNDPCPCGSGKKYKKCCLNA